MSSSCSNFWFFYRLVAKFGFLSSYCSVLFLCELFRRIKYILLNKDKKSNYSHQYITELIISILIIIVYQIYKF